MCGDRLPGTRHDGSASPECEIEKSPGFCPGLFRELIIAPILVYHSGGCFSSHFLAEFTLDIAPDGMGTYDVLSATLETTLPGGPEGLFYVPPGSPLFPDPTLLVAEYSAGNVAAYDLDAGGNPIVASRRLFISGIIGAEGAAVDPLTGDFLFSTFLGGGDEVFVVKGFVPPTTVPEPSTFGLLGLAGGAAFLLRRRAAALCQSSRRG